MDLEEMERSFNERFRSLRKEQGMTQTEIAEALGVSKGAVAMWESGKRTPALKKLEEIAEFFDCSLAYLTGASDDACVSYHDAKAGEEMAQAMAADWAAGSEEEFLKAQFKAYLSLDTYGRRAVDALLRAELERCKKQNSLQSANNIEVTVKVTVDPSTFPVEQEEADYWTGVLLGANE